MRLDPRFFEPVLPDVGAGFSNLPFGTFFVAGRHFNGYHNRFRDIARGGLRVVLPPSEEAHSAESRRHYMECFGLSWAQQLKNKDIPEGGAKAVCLVTPQPAEDRVELMHGCVKRMADAMLDLLDDGSSHRRRAWGRRGIVAGRLLAKELLYLGPDENITPTDLDWIVRARARAATRCRPPSCRPSRARASTTKSTASRRRASPSSCARRSRRSASTRRTSSWTVKLTGGPDGDVAGNMLKILHRDYGAACASSASPTAPAAPRTPTACPWRSCCGSPRRSLPISSLAASKLGTGGVLTLADTPEGVAARNTMHNRVVADAFVPAGGRPRDDERLQLARLPARRRHTPSARVIVEGANLFLTPEARLRLFETVGLPIVKDSSANKCGVICSSMEIRASMCVDDDEFVALKPSRRSYVREMAQASLLSPRRARRARSPSASRSPRGCRP